MNTQQLKELALKAGGDEWEYRKISGEHQVIRKGTLEKCQGYRTFQPVTNELDDIDIAKFIASASPSLVSRLIERLEAAEAEIARRDAAASKPTAWVCGDDEIRDFKAGREVTIVRDCDDSDLEYLPLYSAAPPAVLPPKYADELKDRAELIEAYSKTQCEIAQELGCDSDNESILKAIYELKALGAQPAGLPPDWYFQLTFEMPGLDNMTPYQAHGAAWKQCRERAKSLGAQPQKPVAEVEELSMQIRRLVHSLKNSNPDSSLLKSVTDYMQRKGYWKATDCLRGEHD